VAFDVKPVGEIGVAVAASLDELLARVDAISVCTPDHEHFDGIVRGLEAGKHVLVEKPMVANHEEALRLKPHLDAHPQLVFGVHHQMRYSPAFAKARQLLTAGTLGKPFYLEANYWHDMRERSTRFDDWRMEHGQSLLFGHACHSFDLLMWLLGEAPVVHKTYLSKRGFPEYKAAYTSATTMLKFRGGICAKTHVNSFCIFPQVNNLVILADEASYIDGLLFKNGRFEQVSDFFGDGPKEIALNITDIRLPNWAVSLGFGLYLKAFNAVFTRLMKHPDFGFRQYPLTVYNHDRACQVIIDNFVGAALSREEILVGYEDATRVIKLCEETEADGLAELASSVV